MSVFKKSIYLIFILLLSLSINLSYVSAVEAPEDIGVSNVYYVNIPKGRNLYFISFSDNNNVWIYSIDDGDIRLETDFTLNSLTSYMHISIGEYLKIVSDEPIMVISDIGYGVTYCPSTSGSFVGNSFIVFPPPDDDTFLSNIEIWALGDGMVTIMNETHVIPLLVFEGSYTRLDLPVTEEDGYKTYYNITSTTNIMVSTHIRGGWSSIPSITGQYIGEVFYGHTRLYHEPLYGSWEIIALEPGEVTITNLTSLSVIAQHVFTFVGERWTCKGFPQCHEDYIYTFENTPVKIEGDTNIYVKIGVPYGGQTYAPGRATDDDKIEYWLYGESGGIIFAPEDVTFTINGTEITLNVDEYHLITPGLLNMNHVISPKPLVVQWGGGYSGYLVAPSGIPATKPEIKEEPADNTMIYAGVAVAAIVVVAALVFILKRKS
jgi:hypothetical protein